MILGIQVYYTNAGTQLIVSSNIAAGQDLTADRTIALSWETFYLIKNGNQVSLNMNLIYKGVSYNNYVTTAQDGTMSASATSIGPSETFTIIYNADGTVSFKGNNGLYVTANNSGGLLTCTQTSIGTYEKFSSTITNWAY